MGKKVSANGGNIDLGALDLVLENTRSGMVRKASGSVSKLIQH